MRRPYLGGYSFLDNLASGQMLNEICSDFFQSTAEIPWALHFIEEPADTHFAHTRSAILNCKVEDRPRAQIRWRVAGSEDEIKSNITGMRYVLSNGSLYFPAFSNGIFSPSVHRADYQCLAENQAGTIVSKKAKLRAGN